MRHFIFWITAIGLFQLSCSGDEAACVDSNDCFAGEVCQEGKCTMDPGSPMDAGQDAADASVAADMTIGDSGIRDAAAPSRDVGTDSETDSQTTQSSCQVDPFDVDPCPDDGNDRFDERFVQQTVGCQSDGYVSLDQTRTERLCARETADRYTVSIVECEERGQVLEVRLTPLVSCAPEFIDIAVSQGPKSCAEQDDFPDVQCGWEPDGSYVAQIFVDPGRSITLASIDLERPVDDIDFEYDLQVTLR